MTSDAAVRPGWARVGIVHDDNLGRWHIVLAGSAPVQSAGQRIWHFAANDSLSSVVSEETCPVTTTPASQYTSNCGAGGAECTLNQWTPELAIATLSDGGTQIAAAWHDNRLSDGGTKEAFFGGISTNAGSTWTSNGACTQLSRQTTLVNGGFETGFTPGWTNYGATESISTTAHTGSYSALLGGASPSNGDSSVKQTFIVPPSGTSPTISFWYWTECPDTLTYDWFTATLLDKTGTLIETLQAKECVPNSGWTPVSYTFSAAEVGKQVTIVLTNHDDNYPGDPTWTLVDDVVLFPAWNVPWTDPATVTNGNTPWGDYEGMAAAADGTGAFIPAWGDNRNAPTDGGAGTIQVYGIKWLLP